MNAKTIAKIYNILFFIWALIIIICTVLFHFGYKDAVGLPQKIASVSCLIMFVLNEIFQKNGSPSRLQFDWVAVVLFLLMGAGFAGEYFIPNNIIVLIAVVLFEIAFFYRLFTNYYRKQKKENA